VVLISLILLFWQLAVLFACCFGLGLAALPLLPKEFSLLNKVLFSLMGGLFLVVLIPQNLVYLGVPVRISACLMLAAALTQVWLSRHEFLARIRTFYADAEIRTLAVIVFLTITFHGLVPIRQGLEWYYGRGYPDQRHYVLLAEFLKEEPYGTSEHDIGLRPWLVLPVGYHLSADQLEMKSGPGLEVVGTKEQRIGQSIITAEMNAWSGTDAKAGYAGTVIFFLTLLAICLYIFLRETRVDRFMAGSGALLAVFLPVVTRLSLDGFLSQMAILFVFPFFANLLRDEELSSRSFTLFFSLTLAYVVAVYSEIVPIGFGTLFLGVLFIRHDTLRVKRLMLMSAILIIALVNPYYLRNLIEYLGQQFYNAANLRALDNMAPKLLTLRGWSELIFGAIRSQPLALFFDYCTPFFGFLILAGAIFLSRRDKLIFGAILLPCILVIFYLATRTPPPSYPIGKIVLTVLPFVIGLVFLALSRVAADNQHRAVGVLIMLLSAMIVTAAAAGSARYYSEVFNNEAFLRYVREPRFLDVCHKLEGIKNKRVFVFENDTMLNAWLCYHARHNDVFFDGRFIGQSAAPPLAPFSKTPDLANLDFVATSDRLVDLRVPNVSCLTLVDEILGADWSDSVHHYWLGPPARIRFLAMRPISANLKMRLRPGPDATSIPVDYILTDEQGHFSPGKIRDETFDFRRINIPQGFSSLQISVKAKESDPDVTKSFPTLAVLDEVELSNIDLNPGK
jgi:hypothetical protein